MKRFAATFASILCLGSMVLAADPNGGKLPSGHPDVSTSKTQIPALPKGHPAVAGAPTSQPAEGTLFVEVVQGTAGGPVIANEAIVVELVHQGQVVSRTDAKLDGNGKATISGFKPSAELLPVISITHADVQYAVAAAPFAGEKMIQNVGFQIFESTDKAPEWRMRGRHVIVTPKADGAVVMEMLGIKNPIDRAWIGQAGKDAKRVTLSLPLPKGAKDVQLMSGFIEAEPTIVNDRLVTSTPLFPQFSSLQYQYTVPATDGKVDLSVAVASPIDRMMLFVPDEGTKVELVSMQSLGAKPNDRGGKTQTFQATNIIADEPVGVILSNLPSAKAPTTSPSAAAVQSGAHLITTPAAPVAKESTGQMKLIAGVGAGVIMVVGIAAVLLKPAKNVDPDGSQAE